MRIYTPLKVLKVTPRISKAGKPYTTVFGVARVRCDKAEDGEVDQTINCTFFGSNAERAGKFKTGTSITIAGELSFWQRDDGTTNWNVTEQEVVSVRPFKKHDPDIPWEPKKASYDGFGDDVPDFSEVPR